MKKSIRTMLCLLLAAVLGTVSLGALSGCSGGTEGQGGLTVTFDLGYEGAADETRSVKEGGRVEQVQTPVREGYLFADWYTDEALTEKFVFSTKITQDTTLYAKWLPLYVFEAESTDIGGIIGQGFSGTATGSDMILDAEDAGGGKYVTYLYKNGIELEFGIVSEEAVSDAILYLRLSAEIKDITITSDTYVVEVNGEPYSYNDIVLDQVPAQSEGTVKPFEDYLISASVSLKQGVNTVKLITSNSEPMEGTMYATAPMVDCIKIASSSALFWDESAGFPFVLQ